MPTAVALIDFGTFCRLVPHPPNFSPFGALSLYAGARLPGRADLAGTAVLFGLDALVRRLDPLARREGSGAGARPPRAG